MAIASNISSKGRPDYGIDAPNVLRNLFLSGGLAVALALLTPAHVRFGSVTILPHGMFWSIGICLLLEGLLYLFYVKVGKLHHRDKLLALHQWRGDEHVLDVGCGRGLLLAGAAKRLTSGHATGIDIWSKEDMAGNSEDATSRNLMLEGVADRCSLESAPAQRMPFADATFDVVVSNLCLHNIYDRSIRFKALDEISRVLKPQGMALLSDYKHTGEYARHLVRLGFKVERRWGNLTAFPPLRIVVACKSAGN